MASGNPNALSLEELLANPSSPSAGGGAGSPSGRSLATGGGAPAPSSSSATGGGGGPLSPNHSRPQSQASPVSPSGGGGANDFNDFESPAKPPNPMDVNRLSSPSAGGGGGRPSAASPTAGGGGGGGSGGEQHQVTPHWGQQAQSPRNNNSNNGGSHHGSPSSVVHNDPTQAWINASNTDPHPDDVDVQMKPLTEEQYHPMLALAAIAFISFVCSFIHTGVDAYTYNRGTATLDLTLWSAKFCITGTTSTSCASGTLPFSTWCAALDSRWRAMQAFSILMVLYSAVIMYLGYAVVDLPRTKVYFWNQVVKHFKPVNFILCVCLGYWLFLLILWALIAGSFHTAPCADTVAFSQQNRLLGKLSLLKSGFKLSAGFALPLMMWFYWSALLLWILYRQNRYVPENERSGSAAAGGGSRGGSAMAGHFDMSMPPQPASLASPHSQSAASAGRTPSSAMRR